MIHEQQIKAFNYLPSEKKARYSVAKYIYSTLSVKFKLMAV